MKKIISIICLILAILCLVSCSTPQENSNNKPNKNNNISANKEIESSAPIVYFETNGGSELAPLIMGSSSNYLPKPYKADHTFEGWYLNPQLTLEPTYPFKPKEDVTLYAKWIKTTVRSTCENTELKMWFDNHSEVTYYITPNGLDMTALQTNGYRIKITVTYDVSYKKSYDAPLDIGYFGSPKYEEYLKIGNLGPSNKDLGTTTTGDSRTISCTLDAADFINQTVTLKFSTDNIQNTIYFKNIKVVYDCYK